MIVKTEAIVLKSMRFRETSRIVTFYTRRYGKLAAIAKGARNLKSKFGASLEPMTGVSLVLYKKESRDLQLVSQCDIIRPYKKIHSEIERMAPAMSVLELLHQLTHDEEEHPALFGLLEQTLDALEAAVRNFENFVYAFQLRMSALFGFAPVLASCVRCGTAQVYEGPLSMVTFRLDKGGLLCRTCAETTNASPGGLTVRRLDHSPALPGRPPSLVAVRKTTARIMERLFSADLESLSVLEYPADVGNELNETLRSYLQYHFEDLRPLRSAQVFRSMTL